MKRILLTILATALLSSMSASTALAGTVTDIDGNVYQTVTIGTQVWMAENLKVMHYNNGDSIPFVAVDSAHWTFITDGQSCAFDNDTANIAVYGLMYNWYAGVDPRGLAPAGWHVPTDEDWKVLEVFLGMPEANVDGTGNRGGAPVGAKLKETGTVHFTCPNTTSTNETGFTALPGGVLDNRPVFNELGLEVFFWTSSEYSYNSTAAWARNMTCNLASIGRNGFAKDYGGSVRCIRDEAVGVGEEDNGLPVGFSLVQNYPNPFNPTTQIQYSLPRRSVVTLEVFNLLGERVRTLVHETKAAGTYLVEWDGTDDAGAPVATGVYLYRFGAGEFSQSKKMLLVK